ncbi:hypothetical protein RCL1_007206 [Eukaryota sp. TZLM3-RCL]
MFVRIVRHEVIEVGGTKCGTPKFWTGPILGPTKFPIFPTPPSFPMLHPPILKSLVVGESSVGKTTFITSLCEASPQLTSNGFSHAPFVCPEYTLDIWDVDTDLVNSNPSITDLLSDVVVTFVVYDSTDTYTLTQAATKWIPELRRAGSAIILLIGSRADLLTTEKKAELDATTERISSEQAVFHVLSSFVHPFLHDSLSSIQKILSLRIKFYLRAIGGGRDQSKMIGLEKSDTSFFSNPVETNFPNQTHNQSKMIGLENSDTSLFSNAVETKSLHQTHNQSVDNFNLVNTPSLLSTSKASNTKILHSDANLNTSAKASSYATDYSSQINTNSSLKSHINTDDSRFTNTSSSSLTVTHTSTKPTLIRPSKRSVLINIKLNDGRVGQVEAFEGDSSDHLAGTFVKALRLPKSLIPRISQLIMSKINHLLKKSQEHDVSESGNTTRGLTSVKPFVFATDAVAKNRQERRHLPGITLKILVDKSKVVNLTVRSGDNPSELATSFSRTFGLSQDQKLAVVQSIKNALYDHNTRLNKPVLFVVEVDVGQRRMKAMGVESENSVVELEVRQGDSAEYLARDLGGKYGFSESAVAKLQKTIEVNIEMHMMRS